MHLWACSNSHISACAFVAPILCLCVQVTLATDLLWHLGSREATAAVGYDVTLRQARLQGKIDSTGAPDKS